MSPKSGTPTSYYFPEVAISGYSRIDGSVEFYGRVKSLIEENTTVLDFGAGRGAWREDICKYRRSLHNLKNRASLVIGCDVDEAIFENESLDQRLIMELGDPIPLADNSVDMIVSDFTFEHIANPQQVTEEFSRILRPGGWICARTPNKFGYISILTRLIDNSKHARVLGRVQPDREAVDVFPTTFKLNSMKDINKYFPKGKYNNHSYTYEPEPAYHFNSRIVFFIQLLINRFLPAKLQGNLFIFLKKI